MEKELSAAFLQFLLRVHENRQDGGVDEVTGGKVEQDVATLHDRLVES